MYLTDYDDREHGQTTVWWLDSLTEASSAGSSHLDLTIMRKMNQFKFNSYKFSNNIGGEFVTGQNASKISKGDNCYNEIFVQCCEMNLTFNFLTFAVL